MDAYTLDWLNLLLRWLHIITGIAWIGASFYFIWLDNSLEAPTKVRPRGELRLPIRLSDLKPGEEARVTVAAVDVGILNLTRWDQGDVVPQATRMHEEDGGGGTIKTARMCEELEVT